MRREDLKLRLLFVGDDWFLGVTCYHYARILEHICLEPLSRYSWFEYISIDIACSIVLICKYLAVPLFRFKKKMRLSLCRHRPSLPQTLTYLSKSSSSYLSANSPSSLIASLYSQQPKSPFLPHLQNLPPRNLSALQLVSSSTTAPLHSNLQVQRLAIHVTFLWDGIMLTRQRQAAAWKFCTLHYRREERFRKALNQISFGKLMTKKIRLYPMGCCGVALISLALHIKNRPLFNTTIYHHLHF